MSSFLFNTFGNLYLGLVVSYNRDLNPQYNFSITASWWGSVLANSFKFNQPRSIHKPSSISQFWDFLSVFSIRSMVSGQCWPTVNQREGQIVTEYLAVLVESRIKCETTHTNPDILTEKGLIPWTKANVIIDNW